MKPTASLMVATCLLLTAGCSDVEYSYRVDPSAFASGDGRTGPDPCTPQPCETLGAEGELPGTPVGDSYETTGLVTASGGDIRVTVDSTLQLIGRDVEPGDLNLSALITFDSRYQGIPGSTNDPTTFTVRDQQGTAGLTFHIDGAFLSIPDVGSIDEFPHPAGGTAPFDSNLTHTVVISMNFETREGELTLSQGPPSGLQEILPFELPPEFGVAHSLMVEAPAVSTQFAPGDHIVITPVANYFVLEES